MLMDSEGKKTIKEVLDTLNDEQKEMVYALVGLADKDAYVRGYNDCREAINRITKPF